VRYIEDNFGLPQMAPSDARASDPADDVFDYTQKPRRFEKVPGGKQAGYWFLETAHSRAHPAPKSILGDD